MNKNMQMTATDIPNHMLYDLMMGMKQEMGAMKQEMATKGEIITIKQEMIALKQEIVVTRQEIKQDIYRLSERMDRLEAKVERLELKLEKNTERIEELYLRKDKVQFSFSRLFTIIALFVVGVVAFIVALFTGSIQAKYINYLSFKG